MLNTTQQMEKQHLIESPLREFPVKKARGRDALVEEAYRAVRREAYTTMQSPRVLILLREVRVLQLAHWDKERARSRERVQYHRDKPRVKEILYGPDRRRWPRRDLLDLRRPRTAGRWQ